MTNHELKRFKVSLTESPTIEEEEEAQRLRKKGSADNSAAFDRLDIDKFHKLLENSCSMLYADWWVYEWCHRKKLSQFHSVMVQTKDVAENGKVIKKGGVQMHRDPEWSLGTFQRSLVVRVGADPHNTSAPILKVIDKYEYGQPCDETGSGRKTDVHLMCCERSVIDKLNSQNPKDKNALARIKSISEPETCSYEMFICVQMLCDVEKVNEQEKKRKDVKKSEDQEKKMPLSKFLNALETLCLSKGESWWTYEVCYGKSIRQVHYEFVPTKVKFICIFRFLSICLCDYLLHEHLCVLFPHVMCSL